MQLFTKRNIVHLKNAGKSIASVAGMKKYITFVSRIMTDSLCAYLGEGENARVECRKEPKESRTVSH